MKTLVQRAEGAHELGKSEELTIHRAAGPI
jgi:hypothetical protein